MIDDDGVLTLTGREVVRVLLHYAHQVYGIPAGTYEISFGFSEVEGLAVKIWSSHRVPRLRVLPGGKKP